jgi:hypothetical protein
MTPGRSPELVLAGQNLIGIAFDSFGGLIVGSNENRLPAEAAFAILLS